VAEGRTIKRGLAERIQAVIVPVMLIAFWEFAVRFGWWPRTLIAAPSEVVVTFGQLLVNGRLPLHAYVSLRRLLVGFLIGSAFGVGLGTLVGVFRVVERVIAPTVQLLAPIPIVAWIPLIIIIFGIDDPAKIAVIAFGTFFVVFFSTVQGIQGTDHKLVEVAYAFNKTKWQLVAEILLPSALGSVLSGLRGALVLSWVLLIVAEVIASSEGLGWLIWDSRNFSRASDMIVGMITVGVLGKISDLAVAALQSWLLRWRRGFSGI
jgi:sulfonate transport system permease protein